MIQISLKNDQTVFEVPVSHQQESTAIANICFRILRFTAGLVSALCLSMAAFERVGRVLSRAIRGRGLIQDHFFMSSIAHPHLLMVTSILEAVSKSSHLNEPVGFANYAHPSARSSLAGTLHFPGVS